MTRDAALALCALVVASWMVVDGYFALSTAVSGLVAIANFLLLAFVVRLMVRAAAAERGLGVALVLLLGKSLFLFGGFGWLVSFFGTLAPALGAGSVVLGLSIRGFVDALLVSDDELPEGVR